jgi:hypothetical protein
MRIRKLALGISKEQIYRDKRLAESHCHRAPGVRVLRPAVDQDELRVLGSPYEPT